MKKEEKCDSCEQDFENLIEEEVNEVKGYTKADHEKKGREVKAAFKPEDKKDKK